MEKRRYNISGYVIVLIVGWLLLFSTGCKPIINRDSMLVDLLKDYQMGNFSLLAQKADSLKGHSLDSELVEKVDSLLEMSKRLKLEFSLTEEQVDSQLKARLVHFSEEDKLKWEKSNWLEYKIIDGEKKYFKRTVSNLALMLEHYGQTAHLGYPLSINDKDSSKLIHVRKILSESSGRGEPVGSVQMQLDFSITLLPGSVSPGEEVRCWLPFPLDVPGRQRLVRTVSFVPDQVYISNDEMVHRSVYLEQLADSAGSVSFNEKFVIENSAVWFNLTNTKIPPYDTTSRIYKEYTKQQPPHIVFNERINDISDEVIGNETNPYEIVRRIFYWIDGAIPWAGALEYGVMSDIPGYVLDNFRGDCGMKTLLFMTLARYNGIPVRWQSGWMLFPDEINLHDWCEVYYEGKGWVPVDVSFGLMPSENIREKEFYISGVDAYRLIVNSGIGGEFDPVKYHFRSEPWDFQRGELETGTRNLYFNMWKYQMKVDWL